MPVELQLSSTATMRLFTSLLAVLPAFTVNASPFEGTLKGRQYGIDSDYRIGPLTLDTPWTNDVGTNPWPEYPRPRLQRPDWKNLNGVWRYQNTEAGSLSHPPFGVTLDRPVLVPFCLESALSGVTERDRVYSWYQTTFDIPKGWASKNNVLLNFGAVDYEATVFINGKEAFFHRGGYFEFSVDVTQYLSKNGTNELLVHVFDPTDEEPFQIPIGKQTRGRGGMIWYTPCSGIWQTVWLESVPPVHIAKLDLTADMNGNVNVTVWPNTNSSTEYEVTVHGQDTVEIMGQATGKSGVAFSFQVDSPKLWTPDEPNLYNITITLGDDVVTSYTGFRTISRGVIDGVQRPLLNGEFIFPFGTLDQGYWPDGIYTPPSTAAMRFDLEVLKKHGFNTVRKHIKVEPALYYRACDELGVLVIQDMPSLKPDIPDPNNQCGSIRLDPAAQPEFDRQLEMLVEQLKSYTSIFAWTIYNEEWGQATAAPWPEFYLADKIREIDGTRLINAVSGWTDHTAGDFDDNHHYSTPQCGTPFWSNQGSGFDSAYDERRIGLQGEFGGIGQYVDFNHSWYKDLGRQTSYELTNTTWAWNYRCQDLIRQLREQVQLFSCSGGIWTQTTDVEGEVNGMMTYDRRIIRMNQTLWKEETDKLYETARSRGKKGSRQDIAGMAGMDQFGEQQLKLA